MERDDLESLRNQTEATLNQLREELRAVDEQINGLEEHRNTLEKQLIFVSGRQSLLNEMLMEENQAEEGTDNGEPDGE